MRQQVLKALANPSRIFYVPYTLAVLNFVLQFLVFIVIFIGGLIISGGGVGINPLAFLISVMAVHSILAGFSKREPQLAQIIAAKLRLFKSRAPNKLTA